MTMHVGQPHVSTAETEGAFGMIYAEQMKHGGMKVVDFIAVLDRFVSKFIGTAHADALLDAAPGKPHGKPKGIVIAAIGALGEGRSAEFPSPDNQGRIQKTKTPKITDQGGNRLVDRFAILSVSIL